MEFKMKIITKCIIDIKTLDIEYEESYIYNGPIAECKGGGGGGSTSGAVEHPEYVSLIMQDWLIGHCGHSGTPITTAMSEAINAALGASPWTGLSAYDPDADIAAFAAIVLAFGNAIDAVDPDGDWMDMYDLIKAAAPAPADIDISDVAAPTDIVVDDVAAPTGITIDDVSSPTDIVVADAVAPDAIDISDAAAAADIAVDDVEVDNAAAVFDADGVTEMAIVTDVDAFSDQMNDELDDKILPRFRRGMQNIGAVVSSAFPLGEALIYAFNARDVAKYNGDLRVAATLKNADVDVAIMNKNLEVSKTNLLKNIQVALANMDKDLKVGEANVSNDVQISVANMNKALKVGEVNTSNSIQVLLANLAKAIDVDKYNTSNDVQVLLANLNKNIEVDKVNESNSIQVSVANMGKDIEVGKANESNSIQVALANLNKAIEVAKANANIDIDYERLYLTSTEQMVNFTAQKFGWLSNYTQYAVESNRIKIVAKSEQATKDAEIDESDALWDIELFQHGANLMASASGGTAVTRTKSTGHSGASVLGGAMSGAAAGSMIAPGVGTIAGAVIGGVAGAFL